MVYIEYHKETKRVIQIHSSEPSPNEDYDYCKSESFKVGDEFEFEIKINEIDEDNFIKIYSAIRNNPNAKRLLEENEKLKKIVQYTTRDKIRADELTEDEMLDLVDVYPSYIPGETYKAGKIIKYIGVLLEVIQDHTSQEDWNPLTTASLYKVKTPSNVISEWAQPTGAHDAYDTGDKVIFEGQVLESTIDSNTWSPTEYPAGWKLIE